MAFIEFSKVLKTGVPLIDADHRSLFDLVNRLHESLEAGESAAYLYALFAKLTGYIAFHFNREEKMLKACAYPDFDTHHEEHAGVCRVHRGSAQATYLARRSRARARALGLPEALAHPPRPDPGHGGNTR